MTREHMSNAWKKPDSVRDSKEEMEAQGCLKCKENVSRQNIVHQISWKEWGEARGVSFPTVMASDVEKLCDLVACLGGPLYTNELDWATNIASGKVGFPSTSGILSIKTTGRL